MTDVDRVNAARLAAEPFDPGRGEVLTEPSRATHVQSTRLAGDDNRWLLETAQQRGITPTALIRELVQAARAADTGAPAEPTVSVRALREAFGSLGLSVAPSGARTAA